MPIRERRLRKEKESKREIGERMLSYCLSLRQTGLGVGRETEDISGRKFPLVKGWVLGNIQ